MFRTDRLTFLQLQKTASTYIEGLLETTVGGVQKGKHTRLPEGSDDTYVLGSVRNPWDWYVSLWAFGCSGRGGAFNQATGRKRVRIKSLFGPYRKFVPGGNPIIPTPARWLDPRCAWWQWTYEDPEDPERFRAWLKRLLDPTIEQERIIPQYRRTGFCKVGGLLTFRYLWLFSRDATPFEETNGTPPDFDIAEWDSQQSVLSSVVRMEHLSEDLLAGLSAAGYRLTDEQASRIREGDGVYRNASKRKETARYYDEETRKLVAERDAYLVERYGYRFPE